jgi:hypothetical protein
VEGRWNAWCKTSSQGIEKEIASNEFPVEQCLTGRHLPSSGNLG